MKMLRIPILVLFFLAFAGCGLFVWRDPRDVLPVGRVSSGARASRSILPPTRLSNPKAIQWSIARTYAAIWLPASQPSTGIMA